VPSHRALWCVLWLTVLWNFYTPWFYIIVVGCRHRHVCDGMGQHRRWKHDWLLHSACSQTVPLPFLMRSRSPVLLSQHSLPPQGPFVTVTLHFHSQSQYTIDCSLHPGCLGPFVLLSQNTLDWIVCEQRKFIAHHSWGGGVQGWSASRSSVWGGHTDGAFLLCPYVAKGVSKLSRGPLISTLTPFIRTEPSGQVPPVPCTCHYMVLTELHQMHIWK
jgi:hypothetical protein